MGGSADINKQYTKLTFMPSQADRFVLAFHSWLRRYGNSQPAWFGFADQQPLPSTVLSKREMLYRFEQHTQKKFNFEVFWLPLHQSVLASLTL
ncbi:hypothetical protein SADUNF_Sadunf09G0001900 [Salix dunnii]|uniref:Uncharacterized protein n=1 Tax=Salix dunnii TaxID=1413687 RepID=A0A835JSB6_9ROSI|nr:hypothetical protein SADUNF_Sadunf09G0001900 [Salix dunnii]